MRSIFPLPLLVVLCVGLLSTCARPVRVDGIAMSPTLNDGDRVIITQDIEKIERGDIIEFKYPEDQDKRYLKRVIGLPGETVEIKEGLVLVNDQLLKEEYVDAERNRMGSSFPKITVTPNEYYVLGDNRDNSSDSRYWGTVEKSLIVGKYHSTYASAENKK